jgi:proline iminopeptidase
LLLAGAWGTWDARAQACLRQLFVPLTEPEDGLLTWPGGPPSKGLIMRHFFSYFGRNLLRSLALAAAIGPSVRAQSAKPSTQHPPGAYAQVGSARLWYESEGQGEPIVMISGGPGDSHAVYHPFFSGLADRNGVIYYDAFGVGKSDRAKSKAEYRFSRDVNDLDALRIALKLPSVTLIGHSYGSMVAQAYALRHPSAVKRLILIGAFHSGAMWQANDDNANREIRNQYPGVWENLLAMRAQGVRSSAPAHQDAYFSIGLGLFYFYDAAKAALLPHEPGNSDVYYSIAGDDAEFRVGGDIAKLDFRPELKRLTMPILVIAGRYDRISMPKDIAEYRKLVPAARIVIMERSGHFPYIEEPEDTLRVLEEFLDGPRK